MNPVEIESCLNSMIILVDTREQPSKRFAQRLDSLGIPYRRQKLNYGDYTYSFTFPDGRELFSEDVTVDGDAVVERKMNLEELSGCFCQSRDRFKREFIRAYERKASTYLLVEDGNWEKLINGRYKTKFNSKSFFASATAWMARYGTHLIFCHHELSGKIIKEVLYRELKERLENGFYD